MSLGYIGYCKKLDEDDSHVLYAYSGSNWNNPQNDRDAEMAYDGEILISKNVLARERTKSKQLSEYITWTYEAIENGEVDISRQCKNAFFRGNRVVDYIALHCLLNIFKKVYSDFAFPEKAAFIQ